MEGEMAGLARGERLQIMLSPEELKVIDDWRFESRMPSRAAAIRELLMRGLNAVGYSIADASEKSADFSVLGRGGTADGPDAPQGSHNTSSKHDGNGRRASR
jgi:hypothetical protein